MTKKEDRTNASRLLERNVKRFIGRYGGHKYHSNAELAKAMGVNPSFLSRALRGNPQLDTIECIAKTLNVPIAELFRDGYSLSEHKGIEGYLIVDGHIEHIKTRDDIEQLINGE